MKTELGHYRVIEKLGEGGMGQVYLAQDKRLGRKVAIKVLSQLVPRDDDRASRFEREARAASQLNHPNIVTIYDIADIGGVRFIAMEYVDGRTLRSMCGEPIAIDRVIDWGRQVAEALSVAHAAGIVHRDIKPDNVILRNDGYVKLVDFGVAQLAPQADAATDAATAAGTRGGTLVGTLRYMAPEQLAGRPTTAVTDIFALGATLYELATGKPPVASDTLLGLVRGIAEDQPLAPSLVRADVPATFDALVLQLLQKDASLRPSAADVASALEAMTTPHAPAAPPPVSPTSRAVTVGRERERRILREALADAAKGHGSIVCVAGEPGIGKTTLVEDVLADRASVGASWRVALGRCSERLAGSEAYLPWLEALDHLRRVDGGDAALQVIRQTAPTWYAQIARGDASDGTLQAEIRSASQERLKRELVLVLGELSHPAPVVLFFDDLHWADASTIDLLAYVASRLADMRVLIIVTYRPTDLQLARHPFLVLKPDLQARGICRELVLDFLAESEIRAYLDVTYPGHQFPSALSSLIQERTEGNPLFMADLTRDLRDRGVIARTDETWKLARPLSEVERGLPESVRGMIERKIAQLTDQDCELLVTASVQGYQFDSAIVARTLGIDQSVAEDRLESLERVHAFVHYLADEELPDRTLTLRYRFVHVLYQGALYRSLRPTRLAALAGSIAGTIESAYAPDLDRVAPALATLLQTSRHFTRAAEYFLRAARRATRVFANHEAITLARRGLQAIAVSPESPARARLEQSLQLALGWPLTNVRGYAAREVEEAYARARALHPLTQDEVEPYEAIWGLAMCYLVRGEYERSRALGIDILRLAEGTQDAGALVTAHYMLGTVLFYLGELTSSHDHYAKGSALAGADGTVTLPDGRDPSVSCRAQLGRVLWVLGLPDQARAMSVAASARARQSEQPLTLAFSLFLDMLRRQMSRDLEGTRRCADELLGLAAEHDLPHYRAWAGIVAGWAAAASDPVAGVQRIQESLAAYERMGSELSRPHFLSLLAETLAIGGRLDEAIGVLNDALACVERTSERYYLPEIHRLTGYIRCKSNDPLNQEKALDSFIRAIAEARRQQARSWELRALSSLVGSAHPGTPPTSRDELAQLYESFTEGLDDTDLADARAQLERPP